MPGSPRRSGSAVRRAAVITHGKPPTIGPALERLEKVAHEAGVELLLPGEEVEKHGVGGPESDLAGADILCRHLCRITGPLHAIPRV